MIYKLIRSENINFGDNRLLPPNFREISEEEFSQSKFFQYTQEYREFRQVHVCQLNNEQKQIFKELFPKKEYVDMSINWYADNTGIILINDYWEGKVRYFQCSLCEHEYEKINIGRCLNKYTCKKCLMIKEVDSSD